MSDWAWDDHYPAGVHGPDGYDSVSCSCGWDSETGKLDWVEHIRAMGGDSLDAAWAEAEAALPEGWGWGHLQLQVDDDGTNPEWCARVGNVSTDEVCDAYGTTPAGALRALTAKLLEIK